MSKDERYDVSQHDGITEGPWKIEGARRIEGKSDLRIVVKGGISREANLQFIASSPEILDALKKAYREIDALRYTIGCFAYDEMQFIDEHVWDKHGNVVEDYGDYITDEHRNETASE